MILIENMSFHDGVILSLDYNKPSDKIVMRVEICSDNIRNIKTENDSSIFEITFHDIQMVSVSPEISILNQKEGEILRFDVLDNLYKFFGMISRDIFFSIEFVSAEVPSVILVL